MSSPSPTPQTHDAQDASSKEEPSTVAEKSVEEVIESKDQQRQASSNHDVVTQAESAVSVAGLAVEPQENEGQSKQMETDDTRKAHVDESKDTAHNEGDSPVVDETQQPPTAEPIEEILNKIEPLSISIPRTPPPQPSSKAAGKAPVSSPSPPAPPPKDDRYLSTSNVPSRTTSPVSHGRSSEDTDAADYAAKDESGGDTGGERSEIQSIMEQFEHGGGGPNADEIMSPRLELANPLLESPISHPPRRSSLAPLDKPLPIPKDGPSSEQPLQSPPPRTSSLYRVGTNDPMSPSAHAPQFKPAPPVPDPEPDLPFDFHRFLEQLRHRTADPVAKFLRSFLLEFGKKQWMVHEQVKIIGDFLEFISKKMGQCDVWRTVSDAEFDNAREGMEKLVMNRLYSQTFSPAIAPTEPIHPTSKGRRRQESLGPGRRGQHQEDVERDEILAQKVRIYKWVSEEHLDIKPVNEKGKKFLQLAQQELLKIKGYRAPRDKVICILNCCKVIFGFLRTSQSDQSADSFVPLLIYTVLQANPDHLVSNVQYILRFRNQDKLGGEAGYYISSLMGAVQFIEGLDRTSLTVSDEEFEKNVEAAVSAIAERHEEQALASPLGESSNPQSHLNTHTPGHRRVPSPHLHLSEKSSLSRPEVTPRNSLEAESAGPRRSTSLKNTKTEVPSPPEEENAAVAGLLRTIQRPLSSIGRIFSDNDTSHPTTPQPGNTPRLSPAPPGPPRRSSDYGQPTSQMNEKGQRMSADEERQRQRLSANEAATRQASAEAEEARRIQRQEHQVIVETLQGMFPALDREIIDDVVTAKEGRYVSPYFLFPAFAIRDTDVELC
jgi:hypothetical protein